ncbi:hypothetical protein [Candidatus Leptofilum sp.]|uniref:hypothetical protein n=1 Tax=Candidatus Leptofilum sp. TaxID=3241576 RepID=UPI003B59319C
MGSKLTVPAKLNGQKRKFFLLMAFMVTLLLIVGCQEEQADDQPVAATATVSETAVPPTEATEVEENPEADVAPLPDGLNLVGDVQAIEGEEIAVDVPADAEANLLDLYGWDGTRWVFIPSTFDAATGQRHTADQTLYQAVALVQADAPDAPTIGEVWRDDAGDLTLSVPQDASGLDEQSIALGENADTVYLQLPLDPHAYGEDGAVEQILTWATDNIDRRKLVALIPTGPVVQSGEAWTALSPDALVAHFGALEVVGDAELVTPETAVEVALSGAVSAIEWDEAASAYRYTVGEETVWLVPSTAVMMRMETAVPYNLQGVAFTTPVNLSDAAQVTEPAIIWTVLDDAENVIATESGSTTTFSWAGAAEPSDFTVQADFVSGEETFALGTLPITVAAAETSEEVAEGDDAATIATGILKVNAFVRTGPGEGYAKFPGILLRDSEIELLGRDEFGYWFYIPFENSDGAQTGWVAASLVELDAAVEVDALEDLSDIVVEAPAATIAEAPAPTPAPADDPVAGETPAPAPPSGPPPPVSAPPVAVGGFELGGQTHSFSAPHLMAASGMTWVKFQHKWGESDNPNDLAGRINDAHALGFKVLLSIPGANTYPESINFGAYVEFLAGVAALGPDAIEVWNEMNIDFEWPAGQIDPASYVNNMLAPAYNAIKAANPNVMVISGAPAPTGFDNNTNAWADNRYMAGVLAAGGGNYADCIGAHYNAGASSPSTVSGHPTGSAHYSWYLLPTLNVYAQLGKPVCFTELGYLSGEDYGGVPERFGWAAGTTVDQHAGWLAEAVGVAANTGKVRLIIVFNVDFTHWGDDPQAGYAMIRQNGGCPACDTLARVMGR